MNPLLTIINDGDKLFDDKLKTYDKDGGFIVYVEDYDNSDFDTDLIKSFFHSRELALVEGLKARYEGMKYDMTADHKIEGIALEYWNGAFSLVIAELDEAITYLKNNYYEM